MPQRCPLVKTSHAGPTEASPGRRGAKHRSFHAICQFSTLPFPLCQAPLSDFSEPCPWTAKGSTSRVIWATPQEAELQIVPMSLPLPSKSTFSLFFLSLCSKFGPQWLVSANSQTSLLEDGPSVSDYPHCALTPSNFRLLWGLRAGSGSWQLLWRSSHTLYLSDEQNNGEHFEIFLPSLFLDCVYVCGICMCTCSCVSVHICMQVHTQIWKLDVHEESPLISWGRVFP